MLIRFRVSNFLSFDEMQELSMISGSIRDKKEQIFLREGFGILKAASVFGANASGKSNLIKAMSQSKMFICQGKKIPINHYFRPKPDNADQPSYFEYEFDLGGRIYSYGFEIIISKQEVVSEWLHRISIKDEDVVIFSRTGNKIISGLDNKRDKSRMKVYIEGMSKNKSVLFLHEMARNKTYPTDSEMNVFHGVMDWFKYKLNIFSSADDIKPLYNEEMIDWDKLGEIISSFGTGVKSINFIEEKLTPEEETDTFMNYLLKYSKDLDYKKDVISDYNKSIKFKTNINNHNYHRVGNRDLLRKKMVFNHDDTVYDYLEESTGTKKLLELLKILVSEEEGVTYVIDELDNSLHPQLTYRFVKLFCDLYADFERQLVFTTHESRLMDFQLLRRDEYWFIEKDKKGASRLYSLEEFNERLDRRIDKAYLDGRYGGVPIFQEIYPSLE